MDFFQANYPELFATYSTVTIIYTALDTLISTLLLHSEIWALVATADLTVDQNQKKLMAVAARLNPVEFTQELEVPVAEYTCFAHNTNLRPGGRLAGLG